MAPGAATLAAMIEVEDLVKDYGAFRAVDRVSFRIEPGEVVGFLGPNGAGKTTTLRVLTGFHPASSGWARVHGLDVLADSLRVRAGLGYLPENVPIYPELRVEEYLRWRAALKGVPRREIKTRVVETMERAGVLEVRRKLVGHVSRGYRQRVGLADALVSNPPLLILDEPTSGLDPNQRRKVRDLVRSLKGEHTILFSSHILSDVEDVCDRILLIHQGALRADGPLEGLARSLGRAELRLRIRASTDEAAGLLEGLPIEAPVFADAGDGTVRVRARAALASHSAEDELLDACYERSAARRLGLRELQLFEPSLEELFFQLTAGADRDSFEPAAEANA